MRKMAARIPSMVRGRGFHDSVTGRAARNRAKFRAAQLLRTKKSKYTSGTPTVSSTKIKNLGTGKTGRTAPGTIPPMTKKAAAEYFVKTSSLKSDLGLLGELEGAIKEKPSPEEVMKRTRRASTAAGATLGYGAGALSGVSNLSQGRKGIAKAVGKTLGGAALGGAAGYGAARALDTPRSAARRQKGGKKVLRGIVTDFSHKAYDPRVRRKAKQILRSHPGSIK